jgi:hypothetical protein
MPVETVPSTYYLICYDGGGAERLEQGRRLSDEVSTVVAEEPVTDVVVLSHGWNGDVPAARGQYERWIGTMLACADDREAVATMVPGFRPLIVGLHWPSKAWGDEEVTGASFAVGAASTPEAARSVEQLVDDYAARLADTPAARAAIRTIVEAALLDIAPTTLPPAVRAAYEVLDRETGLPALGGGAEPGADREPFDAEATYQAAQLEEQLTPYGAGQFLGGVLAPLRTLTFWQMKRRACQFGETGAAALLRRLQASAPADRPVRFHLMGHSFGCIVVSACVAGVPGPQSARVDSLTLVQGALSLWSYCSWIPMLPERRGYFHRLVSDRLVRGPVVATTSIHDRAVGSFYPLGAGVARQVEFAPGELPKYGGIGTFGARGPLPAVEDLTVRGLDEPYDLRRGVVYNVECSPVIAHGSGPSGAHSDICHPEIAHLVWSAMRSAMLVPQ